MAQVLEVTRLLAALEGIAWVLDPAELTPSFVHPRAVELLGHSLSTWQRPLPAWTELLPTKELHELASAARAVARGQGARAILHPVLAVDGIQRWFRTTLSRIETEEVARGEVTEGPVLGQMIEVAELVTAPGAATEPRPLLSSRLEAVLTQLPLLLFELDPQGVVRYAAGSQLARFQDGTGELWGRSVLEIWGERPWLIEAVRRALAGEVVTTQGALAHSWSELRLLPRHDEAGQLTQVVGLALDITERHQLAVVLEQVAGVVWIVDASTLHPMFVSPSAEQTLGHPLDRWFEEDFFWTTLVHPDDREPTLALWRAVAADGKTRQGIQRLRAADGEARWMASTVRAVPADDVLPLRLCGVMVDITERVLAQKSLDEGAAQLRLVLEQLPAFIFTIDRSLRFTSGAGAGLKPLGLRADQLTGISVYQYLQTDDPEHPNVAPLLRCLATGRSVRFDADWAGRSFALYVEPFRGEAGEELGLIGVALDETERRQAELERDRGYAREREARTAAELAVRVRDEFMSIASHELRTPITSLSLVVESLSRELGPEANASMRRMLSVSVRQVRRLTLLVDQLLDVSRMELGGLPLALEEVDLGATARDVVGQLGRELERAGCPTSIEAPERVLGRWDRARLEQVITNLLSNAIKYGAGKPVEVRVRSDGPVAHLEVQDHGIGVAPEEQARIFERFERAVPTRAYGGMGLGLFIVRRIVEKHGGTISVDSSPGLGATFRVSLPLAGPPGDP